MKARNQDSVRRRHAPAKQFNEQLEPGQFKPKNEGINNTDLPGMPANKKALNNPTGQDEGLSGGGTDPLADL